MQAGGDVLGGCLTAKHVALEHLGQLIASHVGKVPVGGRGTSASPSAPWCRASFHPTHALPIHRSSSRASALGMGCCGRCLPAGGQTGKHAEVEEDGRAQRAGRGRAE